MYIKEIGYTEARLLSTAQYENARIEISCTVSLNVADDRDEALNHAKQFVRDALTYRIIDMEASVKKAAYSTEVDRVSRKYRL